MAARGPTVAVPTPAVVRSGDVQKAGRAPAVRGAAARAPGVRAMVAGVDASARSLRAHPRGDQKAQEAQAAVVRPKDLEAQAQSRADKAAGVEDAERKPAVQDDFIQALKAKLDGAIPTDKDGAQNFLSGKDNGEGVRDGCKQPVLQERDKAAGPTRDAANAPAPSSGGETPAPGPPIPAPETGTPGPRPGTGGVVPPGLQRGGKLREDFRKRTDAKLKDGRVTEEILAGGADPSFATYAAKRKAAEARVGGADTRVELSRARLAGQARAGAEQSLILGQSSMLSSSAKTGPEVLDAQQAAKQKDEADRRRVTAELDIIYVAAEKSVVKCLDRISDSAVTTRFEQAFATASQAARDRITTLLGGSVTEWFHKAFSSDSWHNARLDGLKVLKENLREGVLRIGQWIQETLNEARKHVADARKKADLFVQGLSGDLKTIGERASKAIDQKFTDLEGRIDDHKQHLVDALADHYNNALARFDEELLASQREAAATISPFDGMLADMLAKVKKLREILKSCLQKGEETIDLILKNPVGFLSNLGSAVKGGLMGFVGAFPSWMVKGIVGWLMGPLAEANVEPPRDLSPGSLFRTAASAIGLSWPKIQQQVAAVVPEEMRDLVLKSAEFVHAFGVGDLMRVFAQIKDQLPDLKSMIIGAIISFLTQKVIEEGVKLLIAKLNPAGGAAETVHAIVNFITWLYGNLERIAVLVQTLISAAHSIALGAVGAASMAIQSALGGIIPLALSFFATMAKLGGIGTRIAAIVRKVGAAVNKAVGGLIKRVTRPILARLKRQASKGKRASGKGKSTVPTKAAGAKGPSKGPSKGAGGGKKPGKPGTKPPRVGASPGKKPGGKKGDKGKDKEKEKKDSAKRVARALKAVSALLKAENLSDRQVRDRLPQIRTTNRLKELSLSGDKQQWTIVARNSPRKTKVVKKGKQKAVSAASGKMPKVLTNDGGATAGAQAPFDEVRGWSRKSDGRFSSEAVTAITDHLAAELKARGYDKKNQSDETRKAILESVLSKGRKTKDSSKVDTKLSKLAQTKSVDALSGELFTNKEGKGPSLTGDYTTLLAKRHIVSDGDLTKHYRLFAGMLLGEVHEKLKVMTVRPLLGGATPLDPDREAPNKVRDQYKDIIHSMHKCFYTWAENLWWGVQPENASYQEAIDPSTMMSPQQLSNHIRKAEQNFGIPGRALKITLLDGSRVSVKTLSKRILAGTFKDA